MATKYPALLGFLNVILLIASCVLVFLGVSFICFYQLDQLDFVSWFFKAVPNIMIILGVSSFICALYGCFVAGSNSRPHLILFSLLMILLFCTQLMGIFAAIELRNIINRDEFSGIDVLKDLQDYGANPVTKAKWDKLHREFSCCGGLNFNSGYQVWRNADIGLKHNAVPDSCCHIPVENCGQNMLTAQDFIINQKIFTHGCVTIMEEKLTNEVVPMLLAYAGVGTFLALIQLLNIVFSCAFSAQINRKHSELEETRSYSRTSTMKRAPLVDSPLPPSTPRFDHVRGYYGHAHNGLDNASMFEDEPHVWNDNNKLRLSNSEEREV